MNLVIEDAVEVKVSPKEGETPRRDLGMILEDLSEIMR